jgi:hypothetical protein
LNYNHDSVVYFLNVAHFLLCELLILQSRGIIVSEFSCHSLANVAPWLTTQVLNKIVEDLFQGHPISERKLKELLGHTPSQVFAGAFLGILVAWFCCQGCIAAV